MTAPIPVTIVTGFLGAGKTTLLTSLVKRRQTRRLALLINEFGEVSVDGALMRESADKSGQVRIHDFPYGLIAYGDDELFLPTMRALAQRRAEVDHVVIETSGLALPSAAMERLQGPELADDFVLDATLAVVDTPLLLSGEFEPGHGSGDRARVADSVAGLFEQQLAHADVVVLNKIDALDEGALLQAEARVRERAPNVRFLELAYHAQLDVRLALGLRLHQASATASHAHQYTPVGRMPDEGTPLFANQGRLNGHSHSGLGAHFHGLTTHKHFHEHDPGWMSLTLRSDAPQDPDKLKAAVVALASAEPVLRCKGFVRSASGENLLVQAVRARVVLGAGHDQAGKRSELVVIGYHPSRPRIAAILSQLTDTIWK